MALDGETQGGDPGNQNRPENQRTQDRRMKGVCPLTWRAPFNAVARMPECRNSGIFELRTKNGLGEARRRDPENAAYRAILPP